jgi:hypothetical protein
VEVIDGPVVPLEQVGQRVPFRQPPVLLPLPLVLPSGAIIHFPPLIGDEDLDVRWIDGRRWRLLVEFDFASAVLERIIRCPAGMETDFASVPRVLWPILSPTGPYGKAALVHDRLYRTPGLATRAQADRVFLEAMDALHVNWVTRHVMYAGVRAGGASSYHGSAFVA